MTYKEQLDMNRIPQHIAIIMDGNGRWAKSKGKIRGEGHIVGAQALHDTMMYAARLGVKYVTVYAFSTENWTRPDEEVNGLMSLLFEKLDLSIFMDNDIRFCVIGDTDRLPEKVSPIVSASRLTINEGHLPWHSAILQSGNSPNRPSVLLQWYRRASWV